MEHTNKAAIQILRNKYSDYNKNKWHYDREYKSLMEAYSQGLSQRDKDIKEKAIEFALWCSKNNWNFISADKNKWGKYLSTSAKKGQCYDWKTNTQLYDLFIKTKHLIYNP